MRRPALRLSRREHDRINIEEGSRPGAIIRQVWIQQQAAPEHTRQRIGLTRLHVRSGGNTHGPIARTTGGGGDYTGGGDVGGRRVLGAASAETQVTELVATCLSCGEQWLFVPSATLGAGFLSFFRRRKPVDKCPKCGSRAVAFGHPEQTPAGSPP